LKSDADTLTIKQFLAWTATSAAAATSAPSTAISPATTAASAATGLDRFRKQFRSSSLMKQFQTMPQAKQLKAKGIKKMLIQSHVTPEDQVIILNDLGLKSDADTMTIKQFLTWIAAASATAASKTITAAPPATSLDRFKKQFRSSALMKQFQTMPQAKQLKAKGIKKMLIQSHVTPEDQVIILNDLGLKSDADTMTIGQFLTWTAPSATVASSATTAAPPATSLDRFKKQFRSSALMKQLQKMPQAKQLKAIGIKKMLIQSHVTPEDQVIILSDLGLKSDADTMTIGQFLTWTATSATAASKTTTAAPPATTAAPPATTAATSLDRFKKQFRSSALIKQFQTMPQAKQLKAKGIKKMLIQSHVTPEDQVIILNDLGLKSDADTMTIKQFLAWIKKK